MLRNTQPRHGGMSISKVLNATTTLAPACPLTRARKATANERRLFEEGDF